MTFSNYQKLSRKTAIYPSLGKNIIYPMLGLCGEVGEVAEYLKKIIRDKGGIIIKKDRISLGKELGDVLWYLTQLASELKLDLDDIASTNLNKLKSREERGVLSGSGDDR